MGFTDGTTSVSATNWFGNWHVPSLTSRADAQSNKTSFFGYDVKVITDSLDATALVTAMTETFHSVIRFILCLTEALAPRLILEKLTVSMIQVDTWIDGVKVVADVQKICNLEYLADVAAKRYASAMSGIAFLIADYSSAMDLVGFLRLIDPDKLLLQISSLRVFGLALPTFVGNLVIGTFALPFQAGAFFFLGIQTGLDMADGDVGKTKVLCLVNSISEVAHKSFLFFAGPLLMTPPGIVAAGVLGMFANGFGVWSAYEEIVDAKRTAGK